jgi:class 3 adenylate cyclase/tetratricopeptide (TPR) repeat protein
MKCPSCQFELRDGAKFCAECGTQLESECTNCGAPTSHGEKFCSKCGHHLGPPSEAIPKARSMDERFDQIRRYLPKGITEKILSQKNKIEGERKQVSVMFCDMVGFTALVEHLGPEKAYSIMDQIYEILIHSVHDYEGTVNDMTGDGIMALFGAPIALEGAPQRALRSALAIHRAIADFNDRNKEIPPIKMRIGIHTGPVVVGTLGNDLRVEFKAVGNTVNLASRMEQYAEPGTTYVTERTFKLTEGLFRFASLGQRKIKGKEKTVPIYKVLAAKEDVYRPRLGSERMIYSELVGRENELDRLELQVMKAINNEGSIVNIIGEAGIGKSRLVAELKGREVMKRVNLLEGRSTSIGANISYHPIIDFLKQWAGIREGESSASAFRKLETAVWNVYPEEVDEILPFVATLMGMTLSGRHAKRVKGIEGEPLEKLILKNIRDLVIKAASLSPLVIAIEDLHWADTSSIELMETLFRLAETQPILFLNIFRPRYEMTSDRIMKTLKEKLPDYCVNIALEPLNIQMSEDLIENMMKTEGLPRSVMDKIIKRADGNPFFIEEVVRSFIDQGALVVKNGAFEVNEKIETMVIPQTINDVLMARIDRLEEKTRDLLKVASVIGRSFFHSILIEVAKTINEIDRRLEYLKEAQFIRELEKMKELEYLFMHALVQETAYASILHTKRKALHLKVAESIEKVFHHRLHEFYGMLSYHCSNGEDLDKAEEYLIKAGEEALKVSASSEALHYYQEALSLYLRKYGNKAGPGKLAMLEKNIALAFFNKGQYVNALEYFDSVLKRWGVGFSKNKAVTVLKLIADMLSLVVKLYLPSQRTTLTPSKRDNEIVNINYKRAVSLVYVEPAGCFVGLLRGLRWLSKFDIAKVENGFDMWVSASGLFSWTGISFKLSKRIVEYAKQVANENDIKQVFYCNFFELLYNFFAGNWDDVKAYDEGLIEPNLRIGEYWHVSTYIDVHGHLLIERGAFEEVEKLIEKLSEIWASYEDENAKHYQYTLRIKILLKSRRLYDALMAADEGVLFQSKTGRLFAAVYYLGCKAIIQIFLNDLEGARQTLSQTRQMISKIGRIPPFYVNSFLIGQFYFDLYELKQAIVADDRSGIAKYRKKAALSGKQALKNSDKSALDRTEIFRLMGTYCWLVNRKNKAMKWWDKSIGESRRFGFRIEAARTEMEIGKHLAEDKGRFRKNGEKITEEYLTKARIVFEEMKLEWDIDELDKIID